MLTVWAPTQALPLRGFGQVAFSMSPSFLIFKMEVLVPTFLGYGGRGKGVSIGKGFSTVRGSKCSININSFSPHLSFPKGQGLYSI